MNAQTFETQRPQLPELVTFEPKTRDIVIGSIKLVLRRLRKSGALDGESEYSDLMKDPKALQDFVQAFSRHRDVARDLAVTETGKPVEDDGTPLICGPTLAQIERLLVYTCAKKVLAAATPKDSEDKGARRVSAELPDPVKDVVGFAWQLPLLDLYLTRLKPDHFRGLGDRILDLDTREALETIADLDPQDLRKAERVMGPDFEVALKRRPAAVRGAALCPRERYKSLRSDTKGKLLDVLSAQPEVVIEVIGQSPERIAALAPIAGDICPENLEQLDAVPDLVIGPLVTGFRDVFGELAGPLMGHKAFAQKFLYKMVGDMRSLDVNNADQADKAAQVARHKWQAIRTGVVDWWATQQARQ